MLLPPSQSCRHASPPPPRFAGNATSFFPRELQTQCPPPLTFAGNATSFLFWGPWSCHLTGLRTCHLFPPFETVHRVVLPSQVRQQSHLLPPLETTDTGLIPLTGVPAMPFSSSSGDCRHWCLLLLGLMSMSPPSSSGTSVRESPFLPGLLPMLPPFTSRNYKDRCPPPPRTGGIDMSLVLWEVRT